MILILLISLYTSRVVLNTLGVDDFGVYEVVGGFVAIFSILSSSLSTAISRFITFSLGKGDRKESARIYSTAVIIQVILAIGIALLTEVIGTWYLHNKMSLPEGRMDAAFWVLQCSIFTFGVGLIGVPFDAEIVAHEDMKVYAYLSIVDAVLALLTVLLLRAVDADRLILYGILTMLSCMLTRFLTFLYCKRNYKECTFVLSIDKQLLKEVGTFTGWHLLGEGAWIINNQGVTLLVNSYFGVTMNAARGIASKVNGLVNKFSANFTLALSPQITKTYAEGDLKALHSLIFRGTKLSYYLMLLLAVPVLAETPVILRLWLKIVPDHSVLFARLTVISALIIVLGTPLVKAQLATGNLKRYQITVSSISICSFPLTWIAYKIGLPAEWSYHIFNLLYFIILFVRVYLIRDLIDFPCKRFLTEVYLRVFIVTVIAAVLPYLICRLQPESIWRLIEVLIVSTISVCTTVYVFGLDKEERSVVLSHVNRFLSKGTTPSK